MSRSYLFTFPFLKFYTLPSRLDSIFRITLPYQITIEIINVIGNLLQAIFLLTLSQLLQKAAVVIEMTITYILEGCTNK